MKYIDAKLIKSTKRLYNDIDSCIDELLKARVDHNQENEGKALFHMEGLMVATLQQLDCIIDSLQQEQMEVDLEKVARLYSDNQDASDYPDLFSREDIKSGFIAGAEWMANQGISFEDKVYPTTDWKGDIDGYCIDGTEEVDLMSEAVPKGLFQVGDKVIVQIRKKED